jgi:hypothetical protein
MVAPLTINHRRMLAGIKYLHQFKPSPQNILIPVYDENAIGEVEQLLRYWCAENGITLTVFDEAIQLEW